MHLRPIHGLLLTIALPLSPLHAQTDHPASPVPVTRAVAVYEWTGDLAHPTAARLIPVSLFIHAHLEDAGLYLPQPIPFALRPRTLYLIQHSGQTVGALNIQSAHALTNSSPAWAAYGNFLTPTEAAAATLTTNPGAPRLDSETWVSTEAPPPATHEKKKKQPKQQAYVTPPTTPILDDPDRPILQSGPPSAPATTPELTALPTDLHQAVAISDAANRPPETFAYPWPTPTSRDQTLQALEALAFPHLTHYIAFNHLTPAPNRLIPAPSSTPIVGPTFTIARTPALIHPQLLAYTLAASTTPTYILTAESPLTTAGPIYLTLIAQPDPAGQLHLTLLSLTDATHLDRTPWLRPIDAVDPDATGRADLLFELRSQTTRQFALYALTTTHSQQTLLTTPIESPPPQN